jgi:hypothetical protein
MEAAGERKAWMQLVRAEGKNWANGERKRGDTTIIGESGADSRVK